MEQTWKPERFENITEKRKQEADFRRLWQHCFSDPADYEEFYFTKVYPYNIVYGLEDKGMLHLNPYLCNIQGKEYMLHYIVGVGTQEDYRRKGIMGSLLRQALFDMYQNEEPFTYLMPADIRYYEPFGFSDICKKHNLDFAKNKEEKAENYCFVPYSQIKKQYGKQKMQELCHTINGWFEKQYSVFPLHDERYFDLLYYEKACQGGDVLFGFKDGELQGFFAYALDDEKMIVEQYGMEEMENRNKIQSWLLQYDNHCFEIVFSFPYMLRVVYAESFLFLFADCFEEFSGTGITIKDALIEGNNGSYCFKKEKGRMLVERCKEKDSYIIMTVKELAEFVFFKKKVFFAEIV